MKSDEIVFFTYCYIYRNVLGLDIREAVDKFSGALSKKRCLYLLKKWSNKGFYDYGVSLDLGWFVVENIPECYRKYLADGFLKNDIMRENYMLYYVK